MIDVLMVVFAVAAVVVGVWHCALLYFTAGHQIETALRDFDVCREAERVEDL